MKKNRFSYLLLLCFTLFSAPIFSQVVRMETVLGDIDIELRPDVAPNTVANFLTYVNSGAYNNSFFHRSIANFVIQGGGYKFENGQSIQIATNAPVANEYSLPNIRGTISMAKLDRQPDSATSQWFINTVDNTNVLGPSQNSGFTVFGTVIAGLDVVDAINNLSTNGRRDGFNTAIQISLNGTNIGFFEVPFLGTQPVVLAQSDAVLITQIFEIDQEININSGLNGFWFNSSTIGQGFSLEYLPTSNRMIMSWYTHDTQAPSADVTAIVGAASHRWLVGIGEVDHDTNSVDLDLILTTGGLFDNDHPVVNSPASSYGNAIITFDDCSHAQFEYNLIEQGLSRSFPIVRVSSENNNLCERLSREARSVGQ